MTFLRRRALHLAHTPPSRRPRWPAPLHLSSVNLLVTIDPLATRASAPTLSQPHSAPSPQLFHPHPAVPSCLRKASALPCLPARAISALQSASRLSSSSPRRLLLAPPRLPRHRPCKRQAFARARQLKYRSTQYEMSPRVPLAPGLFLPRGLRSHSQPPSCNHLRHCTYLEALSRPRARRIALGRSSLMAKCAPSGLIQPLPNQLSSSVRRRSSPRGRQPRILLVAAARYSTVLRPLPIDRSAFDSRLGAPLHSSESHNSGLFIRSSSESARRQLVAIVLGSRLHRYPWLVATRRPARLACLVRKYTKFVCVLSNYCGYPRPDCSHRRVTEALNRVLKDRTLLKPCLSLRRPAHRRRPALPSARPALGAPPSSKRPTAATPTAAVAPTCVPHTTVPHDPFHSWTRNITLQKKNSSRTAITLTTDSFSPWVPPISS